MQQNFTEEIKIVQFHTNVRSLHKTSRYNLGRHPKSFSQKILESSNWNLVHQQNTDSTDYRFAKNQKVPDFLEELQKENKNFDDRKPNHEK